MLNLVVVIQSKGIAMLASRNVSLAILLCVAIQNPLLAQQGGTWTQLKNANPNKVTGTMLQLSDGTVIASTSSTSSAGISTTWAKLTCDLGGTYIGGTWNTITSMTTPRVYFTSSTFPSGKVLVVGGTTASGPLGPAYANSAEIYDPVANKWTATASFANAFPNSQLGNAPSKLLQDGTVLAGSILGPETFIYDPKANQWTQTGTKLRKESSANETWTLLPDGSVLSYDVNISPGTGAGSAQRYVPSTKTWVDAGVVPVPLSGTSFSQTMGPMALLPDKRVFVIGANGQSATYTPASNSWAKGPVLPKGMGADISAGAMLPNGMFLFTADTSSPSMSTPPSRLFEFNYMNNSLTDITPTVAAGTAAGMLATELLTTSAKSTRMLVLPNGHMLFTTGAGTVYDFQPIYTPNPSWLPAINNLTKGTGANSNIFTLTGTQLTGISEGAVFGSVGSASTNFPIVQISDPAKRVHYATTFNWTPGTCTGTLVTSVQFTVPANLTNQTYQLVVIANGIASNPINFKIPFTANGPNNSIVTSSYSGGTLTLTGDAGVNSISIQQKGSVLFITGAGETLISPAVGTTVQQTSYNISGPLTITCNFNQGIAADTISLTSVSASTVTLDFSDNGGGGNTGNITYCTIGTLNVDGGAHVTGNPNILNHLNIISSKISSSTVVNVP